MGSFTETKTKMILIPLTIMLLLSVVSIGFGSGDLEQMLNGSTQVESGDITNDLILATNQSTEDIYTKYDFPVGIIKKGDVIIDLEEQYTNNDVISEELNKAAILSLTDNVLDHLQNEDRLPNNREYNEYIREAANEHGGDILSKENPLANIGFSLQEGNNLFIWLLVVGAGIGALSLIPTVEVPAYIISLGMYFLIWGTISFVNIDFFTEIPMGFGALIYLVLTLMYVLGVLTTTDVL